MLRIVRVMLMLEVLGCTSCLRVLVGECFEGLVILEIQI